jgi:hypothetical protein
MDALQALKVCLRNRDQWIVATLLLSISTLADS